MSAGDDLSLKTVAREAHSAAADLGLAIHPARARVLARRFIKDGHTSTTGLREWLIANADRKRRK